MCRESLAERRCLPSPGNSLVGDDFELVDAQHLKVDGRGRITARRLAATLLAVIAPWLQNVIVTARSLSHPNRRIAFSSPSTSRMR
jgi:hypothetical protein